MCNPNRFRYKLHFLSRNVQLHLIFNSSCTFLKKYATLAGFYTSCTFSPEMCNSTGLSIWVKHFLRNVQPQPFSIRVALFLKKCAILFNFQIELHFSQEICNSGRVLYELHFFSRNVQPNWFLDELHYFQPVQSGCISRDFLHPGKAN